MNKKTTAPLSGAALVETIIAAAQDKLAEKIVSLDLSHAPSVADYFVICESDTDVQNRAIADEIIDRCSKQGTKPWHFEGEQEGRWIVIDFTDVVVHVMLAELREYYNLEELWEKAKTANQEKQL